MICSLALLFFPAFSVPFNTLYLLAGFSDMIDGTVARKTGTAGELGAALDTAADILFTVVCLIKLLPVFRIETWMLLWIGGIALVKLFSAGYGMIAQKRFVSVHSTMNRITGAFLFFLPLISEIIPFRYVSFAACVLASLAAVQEGYLTVNRIK